MKRGTYRKKSNKLMMATLALAIATPVIAIPGNNSSAEAATYKNPFKDIISAHPYYDILHEMRDKGIITGYGDGTFKPDVKISRQHAAVLIQRVKKLNPKVGLKAYKDVPKTHQYYDAIMQLQQTGLIKADPKGNFNPDKELTRGEMALILATAFDLKATGKHPFKDVSQTTEEGKAIAALYEAEITTGYDATTFKPNEPLSRAHYAVFLYRALNYEKKIEKPTQTDIPKMSMDMSFNDFQKVVTNDKSLYDVAPDYKVTEFAFNDPRFKKLLIEGQQYVKQTNFKYKEAGAYLHLEEPNWVNTLPPGYMSTQIGISLDNRNGNISFKVDYTSENAVNLTLQLFKLAYPEFASLAGKIAELAKDAREAYAIEKNIPPGEREFRGNITVEENGEYKLNFGTDSRMEFFWIDVRKK
ncbi:S-layer homology domain-containing protein [Lysinibacillus xylanilyticus]|uniref:S-layer homology domain-containing protein n=1 Tax=Lysinibacillus xylanilyticus TaxID=582475 RepID=UPI002B241669|nr:S-layer homology domain-containing protein [Lysinibacillus xylanilyticus]MEB2280166.1 S-layer homology domain-containing protein [Lysinibacillus xylanilyticus]